MLIATDLYFLMSVISFSYICGMFIHTSPYIWDFG